MMLNKLHIVISIVFVGVIVTASYYSFMGKDKDLYPVDVYAYTNSTQGFNTTVVFYKAVGDKETFNESFFIDNTSYKWFNDSMFDLGDYSIMFYINNQMKLGVCGLGITEDTRKIGFNITTEEVNVEMKVV